VLVTGTSRSWILDFMALWRPRVGMFLGDEEVHTVAKFLDGYAAALEDMRNPSADDRILDAFADFLKTRFGSSNLSWDLIIENEFQRTPSLWPSEYRRAKSRTDGSTRLLYALLDEFLAERGEKLPQVHEVRVGRRWERVFPDQRKPDE
jgi:hypothetical protein